MYVFHHVLGNFGHYCFILLLPHLFSLCLWPPNYLLNFFSQTSDTLFIFKIHFPPLFFGLGNFYLSFLCVLTLFRLLCSAVSLSSEFFISYTLIFSSGISICFFFYSFFFYFSSETFYAFIPYDKLFITSFSIVIIAAF